MSSPCGYNRERLEIRAWLATTHDIFTDCNHNYKRGQTRMQCNFIAAMAGATSAAHTVHHTAPWQILHNTYAVISANTISLLRIWPLNSRPTHVTRNACQAASSPMQAYNCVRHHNVLGSAILCLLVTIIQLTPAVRI